MFSLRHSANKRCYNAVCSAGVCVAALLFACVVSGTEIFAAETPAELPPLPAGQQLAVPAEFVRFVTTPGSADFIKRPTAAHWDRFHHELLIADSGHNRIIVFTASGAYRFEFSLGDVVTAPSDIATDPDGFIYVLGSSPSGRVLQKFDFDGLSLQTLPLPATLAGEPVSPRSMACGGDGRLYVLDKLSRRVLVIEPATGLVDHFPVDPSADGPRDLFGLGEIAISGNQLLIPVSTEGSVLRYGLDGSPLTSIGYFGAKPGTLNFPVAVAVSPEGIIAVLDQGRFCVVCYNQDGQVLGEFGGKGESPGWFINPSLLAIPAADRVVVGQIYKNKIQICALPEFVRGRNRASADDSTGPFGSVDPAKSSDSRHTADTSVSLSSGSSVPHIHVPMSHLEVSE